RTLFWMFSATASQERKKLLMQLETKQVQINSCFWLTNSDEHLALLEDIDGKVDRTNAKVRNTTRRVDRIERKSSSKIMWMVICILVLCLILITFLAIYT